MEPNDRIEEGFIAQRARDGAEVLASQTPLRMTGVVPKHRQTERLDFEAAAKRLEKQDGDAETGELRGAVGGARSDGSGVIFSRVDFLCDLSGKIVQVGHFITEDDSGLRTGPAFIELAGFAGVRRSSHYNQALRVELRGDFALLLILGKRGHGRGEVFDGEQHVAGLDHGDTDGV